MTPQTNAGDIRTESVILGRQDYVSVLLRLIGMELYRIRRRIMSKVLISIAIFIAILVFLLFSLNTFFQLERAIGKPVKHILGASDPPSIFGPKNIKKLYLSGFFQIHYFHSILFSIGKMGRKFRKTQF